MIKETMKLALEWANKHGEIVFAGGGIAAVESMNNWVLAMQAELAKPDFWEGYVPEPVKPAQCKYPKCSYPCTDLPDCRDAEQPAQQEPVAFLDWYDNAHWGNEDFKDGCWRAWDAALEHTSPPAQRPHECSRSHPHENMNAMCELRTEIARLTNENARLKAMHQDDEINTYRMTLLCIRDGLQQGMSKSIQKLQAREINDVLGLPSFASYRTSPPTLSLAQRKPLTDEEIAKEFYKFEAAGAWYQFARAIEAKLREKNQ